MNTSQINISHYNKNPLEVLKPNLFENNKQAPEILKFKNGMKFAYYHIPFQEICFVQLVLKAGVLHQEKDNIGFAHFLEHLISFYPSEKYPDSLKNQEEFTKRAISMNAWTADDNCGYWFSGLSVFLPLIIDYMINNQMSPKWDHSIFQKEKGAVMRELHKYIDDQWYPHETLVNRVFFGGTNLEVSHREELENVKKIEIENFDTFFKKFYHPENMVLSILSPYSMNEVQSWLIKTYPNYFNRKEDPSRRITSFPIPTRRECGIYFAKTDTNEYKLTYMYPINMVFFDDGRFLLEHLSKILTGTLSNRLYKVLRSDLGAVYNVSAELHLDPHTPEYSHFNIETMTSEKHLKDVIKKIREVIEQIKSLTPDEVSQLINMSDSEYIFSLQNRNVKDPLDIYSPFVLWDRPFKDNQGKLIHSIQEEYRKKREILKEPMKIVKMANDLFGKNCYFIYAGPSSLGLTSELAGAPGEEKIEPEEEKSGDD